MMLKIFTRTLVILLVAGLVAGGIYLLAENGGMGLIGRGQLSEGIPDGSMGGADFSKGAISARPEGRAPGHEDRGLNGEMGFSLMGLSGVAMQAGKVVIITAVVVAVQAVARLLKRRRLASTPAA